MGLKIKRGVDLTIESEDDFVLLLVFQRLLDESISNPPFDLNKQAACVAIDFSLRQYLRRHPELDKGELRTKCAALWNLGAEHIIEKVAPRVMMAEKTH